MLSRIPGYFSRQVKPVPGSGSALSAKTITSSRDLADADGNVAYTGIGFQPRAIIAFGRNFGDINLAMAFFDNAGGVAGVDSYNTSGNYTFAPSTLRCFSGSAGTAYSDGTLVSYDSDGFTLAWAKTGSPTGVFSLGFWCVR